MKSLIALMIIFGMEKVKERISKQWSDEQKEALADFTISASEEGWEN